MANNIEVVEMSGTSKIKKLMIMTISIAALCGSLVYYRELDATPGDSFID